MFKLSSELKLVPTWFNHFDKSKLWTHPLKPVQYLIWLMQAGCVLSLLFSIVLSGITASLGAGISSFFFLFIFSLFTIAFTQCAVLGIQARSKLAWLLLASSGVHLLFSPFFLIAILIFYFLNDDRVVEYFN